MTLAIGCVSNPPSPDTYHSGKADVTGSNPTDPGLRFKPLFQTHYAAIHRYCVRRLGRLDAEDAAAEVFAVAWRRIDEMPEGDGVRAWLYGVAHRVVANQYRSRRRKTGLSTRLSVMTAEHQVPLELEPVVGDETDLLHRALSELSGTDRELLRLSSWDGLPRGEIAQILGIKENAVDQRLHRARSRLKTRYDRLELEVSKSGAKEASA
jgi:RNA polymerase sigma factor (sigma-70 family)